MIRIYSLIIAIFLNSVFGFSQNNNQIQDKYLIVLDVQQYDFAKWKLEEPLKEVIANVNTIISSFNPEKVIYIKAGGKVLSITSKGFSVDTIFPELDSNLHVVNSTIFTKIEGDAFTQNELTSFLNMNKANEIFLVGVMAEECIYNTALGGLKRGYKMILIPEAILGTTVAKKAKAIEKLKDKGINVLPMREMLL